MALAASVLGFEIIELWTDEGSGFHCTYIHADEELIHKFPDLIVGHYPHHKKREHKISPMVFKFYFSNQISFKTALRICETIG